MSISIKAICCYGFRIKDKNGEEQGISIDWLQKKDGNEDDQMRFDNFLAMLAGVKEPEERIDERRYKTDPEYKKVWNTYFKEVEGLKKACPITLIEHCGCNQMFVLAIKESIHKADFGSPMELGQSLNAPKEWRELLRDFCERAQITFEEPQLLLISDTDYYN